MAKKQPKNSKRRIEQLLQKFAVTEREVFLAILIAWGVPEGDAFGAVMDCKPDFREQLWLRYKNDKTNAGALALIRELRSEYDGEPALAATRYDLKSKEGMIDALEEQVHSTEDPKQKADILMKIADLQRMKQDENTEKERLVHYYLPLRCEVCPWRSQDAG